MPSIKTLCHACALAWASTALGACGGDPESSTDPDADDAAHALQPSTKDTVSEKSVDNDPVDPAPSSIPGSDEVPQAVRQLVIDAFLNETGALEGEYAIRSAQQRVWPDGGMGCAPLDEVHTQVPVQGYQVVIIYQRARYDYRIDDKNRVRLCQLLPNRRNASAPTQ